MSSFEQHSTSFSTTHSQAALQQQEDALQHQQAAAEANVAQLMQQLRAKRQALTQQQAAAKALKQQVQDSHAAVSDVKQQVAAEAAVSTELMLQLQSAESEEGVEAQLLVQLRRELAGREEGLLQHKCRSAAAAVCAARGAHRIRVL